jgi:hypothetical protein
LFNMLLHVKMPNLSREISRQEQSKDVHLVNDLD